MSYVGDDEYDYERRRRRPSNRRRDTDYRRSQDFLSVDGGGLYRTRSQGARPTPIVNVYNDVNQELRSNSQSPPYPPSPDNRGRRSIGGRLGDDLADDFVDMALENRRLRSRSRGRSDASYNDRRSDFYEWELRRREQELRELERKSQWDREEDRIYAEMEARRLRDEAKKEADEKAAKKREKDIIDDFERKQREAEEDAKDEEKRIRAKIKREEEEAKEKEEREWKEFLRKQEEKKQKEADEKKKKEEEVEEEMRRRLSKAGVPYKQIEAIINDEKEKKKTTTTTTTTTIQATGNEVDLFRGARGPVYAKIHRDYLSTDTLKYYGVPYEYDKKDSNYIIVLREMDRTETEVLFEHTRRLRSGKLLIEGAKKDPQYAFYRKRDRSSSRVKKFGVLEFTK